MKDKLTPIEIALTIILAICFSIIIYVFFINF